MPKEIKGYYGFSAANIEKAWHLHIWPARNNILDHRAYGGSAVYRGIDGGYLVNAGSRMEYSSPGRGDTVFHASPLWLNICTLTVTIMSTPACPFEQGKHYSLLQDISFLNHHLRKGTEVIFKDCAYDFKAGITRYCFANLENEELNAWHVFDSAPQELHQWQTYFVQIK